MLSLKKRKHRKKTRRKIKKGGNAVQVYHIPSDNDTTLLYPIIEVIPLNNGYSKKKYVKDGKDEIIPYFSGAVSLRDLVPILDNGEEKNVFDMLLGKYVPNINVKQSTIYVHSKRDLQMIELYKNIKNNYLTIHDLKLELLKLLETNRHVSKKLNDMVDSMKKYIAAAAAAAPAPVDPDVLVAFKTQFGLPNDIVLEKLSMYESKILDKLYQEIDDDSVKRIMRIINDGANAPPSHKYKLIYSENNDNTYDNIRYVIITLMLNTDILKDNAVAAGPGPGAAPVQGNNNQIPAIVAAIAAANAHAPAPAPGDPLQARALIAAIVAALARQVA